MPPTPTPWSREPHTPQARQRSLPRDLVISSDRLRLRSCAYTQSTRAYRRWGANEDEGTGGEEGRRAAHSRRGNSDEDRDGDEDGDGASAHQCHTSIPASSAYPTRPRRSWLSTGRISPRPVSCVCLSVLVGVCTYVRMEADNPCAPVRARLHSPPALHTAARPWPHWRAQRELQVHPLRRRASMRRFAPPPCPPPLGFGRRSSYYYRAEVCPVGMPCTRRRSATAPRWPRWPPRRCDGATHRALTKTGMWMLTERSWRRGCGTPTRAIPCRLGSHIPDLCAPRSPRLQSRTRTQRTSNQE
ncbi:hypothetical protein C8R46DRAFT_312694 [Mycena filopes]|nr:hypothetical protein C8R46DRAFT_312694 [Mycena filopes]